MTVLDLAELRVQQGGFRLELDRWQLRGGCFHALLGCNGAGKSTLLKAIAGDLPHRGRLLLHGTPLAGWSSMERARHLAVLPQVSQLGFAFSAAEVVALGALPLSLGWRERERAVRRVMAMAGCRPLADKSYPRLSGGEKQRVHLARVLLQLSQAERPPVLLLDEPTSAQDLGQQHSILNLARSLAGESGYAVLGVLHDLNQALRYSHHCSLLAAGRLVQEGVPGVVLTPENVEAVWHYPAVWAVDGSGRRMLC